MRLSELAADVIVGGDLRRYTGAHFQARFLARRWMRRAMRVMPASLIEAAFMLIKPLAHHIFFSRGSFPEIKVEESTCASTMGSLRSRLRSRQV